MKDPSSLERTPSLFAGLTVLSLSLVASSFIFAKAISEFKQANDVLVVTGSAKRPIKSDYIILRLSVSSQEATAKTAYQNLERQIELVQDYLAEKQVPDDAITLSAIRTNALPEVTANGRETGQILAYRLSQTIEIRSDEVEQYAELSQQSTELINEGINLVSEPPEYLYTQLNKLRVEMVAEATKDAKARAEAIASSAENQVGAVRSAKTGVFQITSRNSTDVSNYGIYDTSSLEKDITAVVSVQFGMN
ncbi:conserved hypothetical protein [Hyella patelloides LEGE 07179]|uniref:SIMPL domain-containing protein n=1 Tax=Hyella patelloides LEGE 07179 TaxID=945734 RepID=A0A563VJJ5_9CYAN|nr:SIMPL domain-containing protein [Hyella patelloides]VEP11553.1 conserved hypothetical protein [Hyella patelloides LEGE 07179]